MFRLESEFYRLPIRFDSARLAQEVLAFGEHEWRAHPQGHAGNTALPLVTVGGGINDEVKGPMRPTQYLLRCPYIQQVLASLKTVIGRARLMRIAGESDATPHVDTNYYWMHHLRVHIPAVTYPQVKFLCLDKCVHMEAGDAWIFDSWKTHNVINPVTSPRIHLVADTVGSTDFWDLVAHANEEQRLVPFVPSAAPAIEFEQINFPVVMNPFEQQALAARMLEDLPNPERAAGLSRVLLRLHQQWHNLWTAHGDTESGWEAYRTTMEAFDRALPGIADHLVLKNGVPMVEALRQSIVRPALNPEVLAKAGAGAAPAASISSVQPAQRATQPFTPPVPAPAVAIEASKSMEPETHVLSSPLIAPVFIVSAPRAGSTMLFELLARSPEVWTVGGESHAIIESLPKLQPSAREYDSNRLTAEDADADTVQELQNAFYYNLRDRSGRPATSVPGAVRMVEKTPKNALRIPFLAKAFPGAKFIYLYREPRGNISSILDAWRSQRFVTYPELPHWPRAEKWSLLLPEGWREFAEEPLASIAAHQWSEANRQILDDLRELPDADWCAISYEEVCADPQKAAERLCEFADLKWEQKLDGPLPHSRHTLTPPSPEKWRANESEISPFVVGAAALVERAAAVLKAMPPRPVSGGSAPNVVVAPADFSSEHTSNFPEILEAFGITLAVSTYQAGKLILVRTQDGLLNTHFSDFASPMGLAYRDGFLAVGTKSAACTFRGFRGEACGPEVASTHDVLFLPAAQFTTGDIRIHEIAWAGQELWAVNTRFSCLCTFDGRHNFVPRWRPPFITALAPEDRCHLNGLALVDGAPAWVTCLGATDTENGWRANKVDGGLLLAVPSGEVVARGLSMPHSPRFYDGRLWVLESGRGRLCTVDAATGEITTVAEVPGFTRGLDFHDRFAFIGLSQVRESAVFSGLPICEPGRERFCGVWVVDIQTGQTVAFLRFYGTVQEIFDVKILPARFPEIIDGSSDLVGGAFFIPPEAVAKPGR